MKNLFITIFIVFLSFFSFTAEPPIKMVMQSGNQGYVYGAVFSKNGSMFAVIYMNEIKIWSSYGKLIKSIKITGSTFSQMTEISFSDDNNYLVMNDFQKIIIYNIKSGEMKTIKSPDYITKNYYSSIITKDNQIIALYYYYAINLRKFDSAFYKTEIEKKITSKSDKDTFSKIYKYISDGDYYILNETK